MLEIFFKHGLLYIVKIARDKALLCDKYLMRIALHHSRFLNGLIRSAYPITVEIVWEIVHFFNTGKAFADHKVVLIEHFSWQGIVPGFQKLRFKGAGMDGEHLIDLKSLCVLPLKNAVLGQNARIIYGSVAYSVGVDVIVISHREIDAARGITFFKGIEKGRKILTYLIIAINDLEIFSACVLNALIYALTVTAVLLMNDSYDIGMLFLIFIGDPAGSIRGSVVDDYDLNAISARKQTVDAISHIILRIIAGNCYSK